MALRTSTSISSRFGLTVFLSLSSSVFLASPVLAEMNTEVGQLFVRQKVCPGKVVSLDRCPVCVGGAEVAGGCSLSCARQASCAGFLHDPLTRVCRLCTELLAADCLANAQDQGGWGAHEKVSEVMTWSRCRCV